MSGSESSSASRSRPAWLLPLIICILTLAIYQPVLSYGFLALDDIPFVVNNPALQSADAASVRALLTPGSIRHEVLYIPVTYLSFFIERAVLGLDASTMHLVNVLLHALNGVLLWLLLQRLGLRRTAGVGALLFIVHPLAAEPVSWIMGRKDLLAVAFGLGSILAYLDYRRHGNRRLLLGSLIAATLAMLAKPTLIVLPVLLIACDRFAAADSVRPYLRNKLPFAVAAAAVYVLNMLGPSALNPSSYTIGERFIAVPSAIGGIAMRAALLQPCGPFYAWEAGTGDIHLAFGLALIAVGLAVLHQAWLRHLHALFFGGCVTAFGLLPTVMAVVSSTQARDYLTADRYAYLPLAGLIIVACAAGECCKGTLIRAWYAAGTVGVLLCLMLTPEAQATWRTDTTLWERAVEQNPEVAQVYVQLAGAYVQAQQHEEAIDSALAALELNPHSAFARRYAGDAWKGLGDLDKARRLYEEALQFKPSDGPSHLALIRMALDAGRLDDASVRAAAGASAAPNDAGVLFLYGVTAEQRGDAATAINAYSRSLAINPRQPAAHYNLGNLRLRTRALDAAEMHFLQTLAMNPQHGSAAVNLGTVYLGKKQWQRATAVIDSYPASLEQQPGPARFVQAQAAAALGDAGTMRKLLQDGISKAPRFIPCHRLLAQLELASGNRKAAAEAYAAGLANGAPKDPAFEAKLEGSKQPQPTP